MNQFRFDINDNGDTDDYDGPVCPRVVECKEYAPHMHPSSLDMALAGMALDALMYDMENGYTQSFLTDNPDVLKKRDVYMNKRLAERLRKNGFQVRVRKDGTIDASELLDDGDGYLEIEIDELKSEELDIEDDSPWTLDDWK